MLGIVRRLKKCRLGVSTGKSDSVRLRCDALRCEAVCAREEERFCWLVFPELPGPGDHDVRVWWNGTQPLEPLPFHFIKGGTRQILRPVPAPDPASRSGAIFSILLISRRLVLSVHMCSTLHRVFLHVCSHCYWCI